MDHPPKLHGKMGSQSESLASEGLKTHINGHKNKKALAMLRLFADRTGLEPATSCVTGRHSNQLNYRSNFFIYSVTNLIVLLQTPKTFNHLLTLINGSAKIALGGISPKK